MNATPVKIKFVNKEYPESAFDMLRLEDLYERKDTVHDIETLQKVDFYLLLFITKGHGKHTVDFKEYAMKRGTILTIRKDQVQKFNRSKTIKGFILLFTDDFLVSYLEKVESDRSIQLFNELLGDPKIQLDESQENVLLDSILRMYSEYFNQKDAYSLGIIRSELHIMITKLFRIKTEDNNVTFSKRYLADFITLQKLVETNVQKTNRVADYARMMMVSTKTLNTITKSIIDKTAKEFIDDISIKQIKRLLINTSDSIKEIAYSSGFEETTNFYKYFKRHVHDTPDHFRSNH